MHMIPCQNAMHRRMGLSITFAFTLSVCTNDRISWRKVRQ